MKALVFLHARLPPKVATVVAVMWLATLIAVALFFFGDAGEQFRYLNV